MQHLHKPPHSVDVAEAERARLLFIVAWGAIGLAAVFFLLVMVVQPSVMGRAAVALAVWCLAGFGALRLSRAGRTVAGSWLLVGSFVALATGLAIWGAGIRNPGVSAYFVVVLVAGLLLGQRAGIVTGIVCAAAALGLVLAEWLTGAFPAEVPYSPATLWLLNVRWIGVTLVLMHLITRAQQRALRRTEAELAERRRAEHRLALALGAGHIGVWEYDVQAGAFRGDDLGFALFGLAPTPDAVVPLDLWMGLVHPEDRSRVTEALEQMASGAPRVQTEYRVVRPDGAVRQIEAAGSVVRGEDGEVARSVSMVVDVTERRTAEQERERLVRDLGERVKELQLLHSAARLLDSRSFSRDVLAELVVLMPLGWMHTECCEARIVYQDVEVTTPGWRRSPWLQATAFNTDAGSGVLEVVYTEERPAKDEGPFLSEERLLIDSLAEMLSGYLERDQAEKRRRGLESQLRQAQKMDALGTLAGGIAHDFNNILTAIGGNVELARHEVPDGSFVQECLTDIGNAHARATDLVRRILLFSRQQESERTVVQVEEVVDEALKLLRSTLPVSITKRVSYAPNLPPVLADPTQLHQIVMNLATNAGHAMQESGGVLSVDVRTVSVEELAAPSADLQPGLHVCITVGDTGTGMSNEIRDRLFEPFFTTKGAAGTGLGLSVVHGIVREHGGAITIDSELGRGSVFRVFLPAAKTALPPSPSVADVARGKGEHVMYVDDEEPVVYVVCRILRRLGYQCTGFSDPGEALHAFRTNPHGFQAVIVDLNMPGMSGVELAQALRLVREDTPVAIASGYLEGDLAALKASDIETRIRKPFGIPDLSRVLRTLTA